MWVGSASPHFWRIAASMSSRRVPDRRRAHAGHRHAASAAPAPAPPPKKTRRTSIARTNPIRVMSPSRRKNCYLGITLREKRPKSEERFCSHATSDGAVQRHTRSSLSTWRKKMGRVCSPPHAMSVREHPATSPLLRRSRDPNLVRAGNIDVPQLGPDAVRAQVAFPFRWSLGIPAKEILVLQDSVQLFQERRKSNRRLQSLEEGITASLVRDLRQVALPVIYAERCYGLRGPLRSSTACEESLPLFPPPHTCSGCPG